MVEVMAVVSVVVSVVSVVVVVVLFPDDRMTPSWFAGRWSVERGELSSLADD